MFKFFSLPPPVRFLPWKSEIKAEHLLRSILLKSQCFYFSLKLHALFLRSRRHREHCSRRDFLDERYIGLRSLHQCLDSPKFPKSAIFLIRSIFKLAFRSYYKFEFLHHELRLKHNFCGGVFRQKLLIFSVVSESGWYKSSTKHLLSIMFFNNKTHPSLSPIITSFISSIEVCLKTCLVGK